ncbi:macro domain-containing protein [Synechocystis sp. LEGE 06083]|uniref:type II toxin-antitoxin system antitoxin DNA ADP-ribosyl glycohydrolase DarG n=1 Tax=Synechocystis sp. LEGE 06083 TaxID=915336 RepID=UPI001880FD85|nr:macro domain-containing protein [Synechocystis sp. LEGE 06083]MBE9194341.1 macro domain-containing protein [Synechocystis sp. LEGE 06083]
MFEHKSGNILTEDTEALVNTVNCVGVMGRGIALQFKKAFPENFKAYAQACKEEKVKPGEMFVFQTGQLVNPRFIINFPTKRHWRTHSRIDDIENGLKALKCTIQKYKIRSIAIPPLGCGLGGLDWAEVKTRIEVILKPLDNVKIILYEPHGELAQAKTVQSLRAPKMTPGRAVLVELVSRYLQGLLDPFITLLEIHKLMYFMQESGEFLQLRYAKAPYGPYAENLRHVLNVIEGHLITGYADGGDQPNKPIALLPNAIEKATTFLQDYPETHTRFEKVTDLVEGFESPFGLELLSTVHWIVKNEPVNSLSDVIDRTYAWNQRKQQFTQRQIELAVNVLNKKGWINRPY